MPLADGSISELIPIDPDNLAFTSPALALRDPLPVLMHKHSNVFVYAT